ncbi:hypothetical protein GSU68_19565 (plasmid) [Rathayibacter sp. VKM Ac-2759]|nr:hypothetical protein [Rathayibacter sp. VKM Ac-2759]QHC68918.1 hypothetical protein GSU68_19565 [Rathayibacter sp. VKM Ac-2759]
MVALGLITLHLLDDPGDFSAIDLCRTLGFGAALLDLPRDSIRALGC